LIPSQAATGRPSIVPLVVRLLFAGILTLLCLEALAWAWLALVVKDASPLSYEDSLYQPHPYVGYSLRPGYRREVYADGSLRINADGFRGPELRTARGPRSIRIVCLGGSTTFSIRTGDATTYPRLLEAMLQASHPDAEIEVVNAGVGAYTSAESLATLATRVLDLRPDVIVVYHAVNDVHPRVTPGFRRDYGHYRKALSFEEDWLYRAQGWSRLARLVHRRRVEGQHIRHLTTHVKFEDIPTEQQWTNFQATDASVFRRNVRSMVSLAQGIGADVVLSSFTYSLEKLRETSYLDERAYSVGIAEHNAVMRELADELGLVFVDLAARFPDDETDLFSGSVHLRSAGTRIKARIFHDAIEASGLIERRLRGGDEDASLAPADEAMVREGPVSAVKTDRAPDRRARLPADPRG
jgi:lysophospholipase L1-like esterase